MAAESDLLAALSGSATLGAYPDTVHDRLDRALVAAWTLSTGLGIDVPASGGDPGPYRGVADAWSAAYDQVLGRYGTAPKARSLTEKAQLLEALTRGVDAARTTTPPPGPPSSSWKTLAVMTSSAVTGANDSHQSAVPSFAPDGMHVKLPAAGGTPGPGASAPSGSYQRCEAYVAGWENLTGTLYLRYDFTLLAGFPTSTSAWVTIGQCKNSSTGSPPLELMVGNKAGATNAVYVQWHNSSGSETGTEILGAATAGVWHSVVLGVQFSTSSAATVSGWFDGAQSFVNKGHGPTLYSGQSSYGKVGQYRDAAVGKAAEIVFRGVAKGATFASVTA